MSDSNITTHGSSRLSAPESCAALADAFVRCDVESYQSLFSQELISQEDKDAEKVREISLRNTIAVAVEARDLERINELLLDRSLFHPGDPFARVYLELGLSNAVKSGAQEIVQLLLQNGARMTRTVERTIFEPLTYDVEVFKSILNSLDSYGWIQNLDHLNVVLWYSFHRVELLEWALEKGANPNTNILDQSILDKAARYGTLKSVELLFEHGAKIDNSAVPLAAKRDPQDPENIPILQLLLSHGGDLNIGETHVPSPSAGRHLRTALYIAAERDDVEMANWMMKHGADPKVESMIADPLGNSYLYRRSGTSPLDLFQFSMHPLLQRIAYCEELRKIAASARSELNIAKAISGGPED